MNNNPASNVLVNKIDQVLQNHQEVIINPERKKIISLTIKNKDAVVSANGSLAVWTHPESTGRSPKDTLIVKRAKSEKNIDWDSPNNIPVDPETFDMVFEDALEQLGKCKQLFITDRVLGADSKYALPTRTISDKAIVALFTDNMFRPVPKDIKKSVFSDENFTLIVLPNFKLDRSRYEGKLRKLANGKTSNMFIGMDMDRRIGIICGSAYCGSVKKTLFTVMNYYLPFKGVLPLHCSSNEGINGDSALLLGLSGTGKTTLSSDPKRALLGDDEHGWSDRGISNFENGCYAKLINLQKDKEPEIYDASFHEDIAENHGAIIENCMMWPDGTFDLDDERLTPNSRASYPLTFLTNIKKSSTSGHPKTILFLTADANGVLPPISKLTKNQAMLWFLMGYTSKLAGTETGITEPQTTFSRFFGEPFMPLIPEKYASMLGEKMKEHGTQVYLVNTGWSGGPFGEGSRMDINLTRSLVNAALSGVMKNVEYIEDPLFHIQVPKSIPKIDSEILIPRNTWKNKEAYDLRAKKLASEFSAKFDKSYGNKNINQDIKNQCPGK